MNVTRLLVSACTSLALALAGCAQMGEPAKSASAAHERVVIQVSDKDPAKWNLALNNARNVRKDLGDRAEIEIVAYGPGIDMLKRDSSVAQRIDEATMSGMKVVACENTMHGHKLSRSDMIDGIGYVQAGVVEIMRRQQQGWSYVRP
jgi:intracellular sulfur oxidation DsrE/DsrF family protein